MNALDYGRLGEEEKGLGIKPYFATRFESGRPQILMLLPYFHSTQLSPCSASLYWQNDEAFEEHSRMQGVLGAKQLTKSKQL